MNDELKPYPEYKESGIPWQVNFPSHWRIVRLDQLFDYRSETPQLEDQRVTGYLNGRVTLRSNVRGQKIKGVIKDGGWKRIYPGDFAISGMNAHLGGMGVSDSLGKCSPIYMILEPKREVNAHFVAEYMRYIARIDVLKSYVNTIRYNSADMKRDALKLFWIILPYYNEQHLIVKYLSYKIQQIDRLILLKRKLIALLNEQKQAIIQQAVTRGLDPDVRLKPSGISWAGDIPTSWVTKPIKHSAKIGRGKFTHRPRNDPDFYDGLHPFIQTGEVARSTKIVDSYRQTLNEKGLAISKKFPKGTLMMTIAANIGDVAILGFDACFPDSVVGFVPFSDVDCEYLYYSFRCMKEVLLSEAPVNTQGNLNIERIGSMRIPVPSIEAQKEIVRSIEADTLDLDRVINLNLCEIKFIQEYRNRLIADVVTGQLDVREVARNLPDEPDDQGEAKDLDEADFDTEDFEGEADV